MGMVCTVPPPITAPRWVSVHTASMGAPAGPSGRALATTGSSGASHSRSTASGANSTVNSLETVH